VTVHAFVDESRRSSYLLAAAVLRPDELARARSLLRSLLRPQDRRLHFKAMTDPRRRATAARLVNAGLRCWVYTGDGDPEMVRQACLDCLVAELREAGCQRLVLESRGRADDHRDARTITSVLAPAPSKSGLVHEHLVPYEDPLLWIPDAVGWCYGASTDYRRRIAPVIERTTSLGTVTGKRARRR
jgi:hypothetical protein